MHRRHAGLRPIPDQHEDKGDLDRRRVEGSGDPVQLGPAKRVTRHTEHVLRCVIQDDRPEQCQGDSHRTQDHELPPCLQRRLIALEGDQQGCRKSRALDCNPHEGNVRDVDRYEHGSEKEIEKTKELTKPPE